MTRRIMHDLGCTCGRHFRRVLYHAIDAVAFPGLRYAVLGGVLNTVQCPSCEREARVSLPFLYQDARHAQLVYVYPAEAAEQAGAIEEEIVRIVQGVEQAVGGSDDAPRPAVLFGLESLAAEIEAQLGDEERPGAVTFDVRPGIKPERAARVIAGRVALQAGGYVHSWREGGRLHIRILGPRGQLEAMTIDLP